MNPLIIAMPCRGSNDNLISLLVFVGIYFVLKQQYVLGGFFYGLSVHFKIYPIIYCFPLYFFIDCNRSLIAKGQPYKAIWANGFFTRNRLVFTAVSAGTFIGLTAWFYGLYGYEFLYEAYLYHFVRKDHRHNNSVYWYMIYQLFDEPNSTLYSILMFIPQWSLIITSGCLFYYDLWLCLLMQTYSFVIFNKVMTAQYYLWYLAIMPLAAIHNPLFV